MFLRGALGAALLAVPLTGVAGQSTSQQDSPARAAGDSNSGHHFAWVVGTAATGAAFFTAFVHLSERSAAVGAERGLTLPNSPVPNHYTDGTLPGSGVSPGQNAPPPGQSPPPGPSTPPTTGETQGSGSVGGTPGPIVVNLPPNDPPPTDSTVTQPPTNPTSGNQSFQPPPSYKPPVSDAIVVTTPEPESIFLLGTGVVALIPAIRRRRARS